VGDLIAKYIVLYVGNICGVELGGDMKKNIPYFKEI